VVSAAAPVNTKTHKDNHVVDLDGLGRDASAP
jgi:hypothetical protein